MYQFTVAILNEPSTSSFPVIHALTHQWQVAGLAVGSYSGFEGATPCLTQDRFTVSGFGGGGGGVCVWVMS